MIPRSFTVLVVDDTPSNVDLVRFLLESEGYVVRTASNADEAMAVLDEALPDLILMDIQLPGVDGLELTRRLKASQRTRAVPIVALSANAMDGDAEAALLSGCDGYLSKPIDTRAFPGLVARFFEAAPPPP